MTDAMYESGPPLILIPVTGGKSEEGCGSRGNKCDGSSV